MEGGIKKGLTNPSPPSRVLPLGARVVGPTEPRAPRWGVCHRTLVDAARTAVAEAVLVLGE